MAIAITIPRLGWNMDEGVFVGWLKQDGDEIKPGDALFSLEGEKATEDIEAMDAGILRRAPGGPRDGEKVAVGTVVGHLVQPGEAAPAGTPAAAAPPAVAPEPADGASPVASPAVRHLARQLGVDLRQVKPTGPGGRVTAADVQGHAQPVAATTPVTAPTDPGRAGPPLISPRARRVAAELGVDWQRLKGSGRTGRIREQDVRAAATRRAPAAATAGQSIPVTPIRRTIAERLLTSARSTVPVTLTTTVDATNLVNLRGQFRALADSAGALVPGYTDFLVKLAATALRDHPLLNARWTETEIVPADDVHVGIAVDTDAGLLVPVVRGVPGLTLRQVAERSRDLAARARAGKLRVEEMQGGTFTVTNLGSFGVEAFTPVINHPQCAVLGVGRIERQPAVVDDRVVPRDRLVLSLTFDHRIVDGAPAARFFQHLARLVENPAPVLMG